MSGSVQAGPMWLFHSDFPSCSDRLKFDMSTLFVLKNIRFFFQERRKIWTKLRQIQPPLLCPSPNNIGFRSFRASQTTVRVFCTLLLGGGGGGEVGVDFQECAWILVSRLWKKNCRDIFSQKRRHAEFERILSNLENHYEIVTQGRLARSPSILMGGKYSICRPSAKQENKEGEEDEDYIEGTVIHCVYCTHWKHFSSFSWKGGTCSCIVLHFQLDQTQWMPHLLPQPNSRAWRGNKPWRTFMGSTQSTF